MQDGMKNILFINACVRPESRTLELARLALEQLRGQVTEVNLEREAIVPLTGKTLEQRTAALEAQGAAAPCFRYARQFAAADAIVVAAPYWDLSFPASLKAYIEAINVVGVTFQYNAQGVPESLCKAKELYYIMTAGGPVFADFGYGYVKAMAEAFYHIPTIRCVKAEGLDIIGADVEGILAAAKEEVLRVCHSE